MADEFSPELQSILTEEGITDSPANEPTALEGEATVVDETPPEEGFDLGKAALDVTLGVPEAVGLGAVNSVGETIEALYGGADWVANRFGGDLPDKEYVPYEPQTTTGKVLEPIARFVGGFIGAGKFLKMAGWAKKGKKAWDITRAAVQGGLADYFSFDAHEQRLSNLVQENPALRNPVTEYLQAKPEDSEAEGRFKNVVEGLGLGVITDGLFTALKRLKHLRRLRATQGDAEAAKVLAKNADSVDAELDVLFPKKIETKVEGRVLLPEVQPKIPITDAFSGTNEIRNLSDYTDTLYRESSVDNLVNLVEGQHGTPFGGERVYFSNAEELATGQGKNTGVFFEIDAQGVSGKVNTAKPGLELIAKDGKAEFYTDFRPGDKINLQDIKRVEFDLSKVSKKDPMFVRMKNKLTQNGYVQTLEDGKLTFTRPENVAPDLPPLLDESGKPVDIPPIDEVKAEAYGQEFNRILEEGGDPTKINLEPYIDPDAFQSADRVEELVERMVQAVRDNDQVISHPETIEEAEKQFSETIANLADITDVSKGSLTQTLLRDAETIREAGIRGVVVSNVLDAIAREADRLAPLVKNLDDDAARQLVQLQEAAYRIVPADALVGSELGRSLNARKVRSTFAKDAAEILQHPGLDPLELAEAIQNAKNAYAKSKTLQLALDTITRVRINAMLSGPVTHLVNITSNLFKTGLAPSEYILGGLVQSAKGLESGKQSIRQGLSLYRGIWASMADSWRMAGSAIRNRRGVFRGGEFSQLDVFAELDKAENVVTNAQDALRFASIEDLKVSSQRIQQAIDEGDYGKLTSLVWSTGMRTLGAVIDVPTTLLNGADEFFLNLNGRGMLYSELTEKGLAQGLEPGSKELSQFIEEGFQKYFSQNGALIREDEIGRRVFQYATDSNFSKAMTGDTIFGKVGMLLKSGAEADGFLGFAMQNIAPFIRTPVNLIEDVINHVPGVNMVLNRAVREDLRAGGIRQARRIGEMITGSMFLATAAGLVSQGFITGSGPTNPQLRDQLKKAGWKPYSLRIPDPNSPGGYRYFELARFEPYSTYFTVMADFMEAQQAGARGDTKEFYSKLVGSITSNLTSRKYLTGLIDTMDLIGGMAYGDLDSVEKFTNDLAGSFVPSMAKAVREMQDPLYRDARNFVDAMRNRTPFLSENVPVQYDFRGKPSLTPILSLYTRSDMDEVDVEVLKLSQLGGQVDTVSNRDRRFLSQFRNRDGKTAYERLNELMGEVGLLYFREDMEGKTLTDMLKEVIKSEDYQAASDPFTSHEFQGQGGKVMMLRNEVARYRDAAMEQLLLEGFKNEKDEGLAKVLEIKKTIPKVQTQEDLQEFLQSDTGASGEEISPDTYAPIFEFGQ